jgi:chromosome segregation ATPase
MSYWKAYALASDTPDADLRSALVASLETLHLLAGVLDCDPIEGALIQAAEEQRLEAKEAREACEAAEDRLEERLQEPAEDLRDRLATAEEERDQALARLSQVEPLLDAYSDHLAMARRFVSAAEGAGVKVRHVRKVKPTTASAKRSGGR